MYRQSLLRLLREHRPTDPVEQVMTQATISFVEQHPDCFDRSLQIGHITGSAWVVSSDRQQFLLIHHRKLDRWLQPGGHADGDPDVAAVALREAQEETGLTSLKLVISEGAFPKIFDVDIHSIPERAGVPEHLHYDIRFLIEADPDERFGYSHEVKDIRWFSQKKSRQEVSLAPVQRLIDKITRTMEFSH